MTKGLTCLKLSLQPVQTRAAKAPAVPVTGLLIKRVEKQHVGFAKAVTPVAKPCRKLWEDFGKCPALVMIAQHERSREGLIGKELFENFILGDTPVVR